MRKVVKIMAVLGLCGSLYSPDSELCTDEAVPVQVGTVPVEVRFGLSGDVQGMVDMSMDTWVELLRNKGCRVDRGELVEISAEEMFRMVHGKTGIEPNELCRMICGSTELSMSKLETDVRSITVTPDEKDGHKCLQVIASPVPLYGDGIEVFRLNEKDDKFRTYKLDDKHAADKLRRTRLSWGYIDDWICLNPGVCFIGVPTNHYYDDCQLTMYFKDREISLFVPRGAEDALFEADNLAGFLHRFGQCGRAYCIGRTQHTMDVSGSLDGLINIIKDLPEPCGSSVVSYSGGSSHAGSVHGSEDGPEDIRGSEVGPGDPYRDLLVDADY